MARLEIANFWLTVKHLVSQPKNYYFLLLAGVIALSLWPLWLGRFYAIGDMRDVFIPLESFFREQQLQGRIPAWNPDIAWGFPVIASAQIGFFYPPLLLTRAFPLWFYLPLLLFAHFLGMAYGTFLFIKRLQLSLPAAFLGGLTFALSAYLWQHLTHLNIIFAVAWLPWQLLLWHHLSHQDTIKRKDVAQLALLGGIPVLAGQLQIPLLMLLFGGLFFIFERRQARLPFLPVFPTLVLIAFGVIAVSCVQLLPTWELLEQSSRSTTGDFNIERANQHSFPLYHLPTLYFPRFFSTDASYWGKRLEIEYGIYIGILPISLAFWAMHRLKKAPVFWVGVVIVSFLLSLGSLSPFRLLGLEPSLWVFSAPARWLLFTTFSLSVLAALGLEHLKNKEQQFYRFLKWQAFFLIFLIGSGNILLYFLPRTILHLIPLGQSHLPSIFDGGSTHYYTNKLDQLIISLQSSSLSLLSGYTWFCLGILAAAFLTFYFKIDKKIIIGISLLELLLIASFTVPTLPWRDILSEPTTVRLLPTTVATKQARLYSSLPGGDTGAWLTNPESRANAKVRKTQQKALIPLLHSQYGIAGVSWPASLDLVSHTKALDNLTNSKPFNIQQAQALNIGAVILPTRELPNDPSVASRAIAPELALLELTPRPRTEVVSAVAQSVKGAKTQYVEITPSQVRVTVSTPEDGLLIIRNTFYPGWEASIDGLGAVVVRYNDIFQAIPITSGQHEVTIRYVPRQLYLGAIISGIAVIFCLYTGFASSIRIAWGRR